MEDRLLVIDASLNKRLARALRERGRTARSLAHLGEYEGVAIQGMKDHILIPTLHNILDPHIDWTLVTADDRMPDEHKELIAQHGTTIATLKPYTDDDLVNMTGHLTIGAEDALEGQPSREDQYQGEIVHRWVHVMARQHNGTVRRYFLTTHRPWTPRRT